MHSAWIDFIGQLKEYPDGVHRLCDACSEERILAVEREFGSLPKLLAEMVRTFNGGELFLNVIPMVTLFGISPPLTCPNIDSLSDWYIDKYTWTWRAKSPFSDLWAFAMTNYGGLMLMSSTETVKEWDTNTSGWIGPELSFTVWIQKVIEEGDKYLTDKS